MIETLRFIFSSFWHWLGFLILLGVTVHGLGHMFSVRVKKTIINDSYDDEEDEK